MVKYSAISFDPLTNPPTMSAIYVLIGVSIPVALGFLIVFIIAARSGQFDDDYTPSIRMLMDDDVPQEPNVNNNNKQAKPKQV